MNIIQRNPNPSGAYPAIQTWVTSNIPADYAVIPDNLDMSDFYAYNGFVTLTIEDNTVTSYTTNVEAWEAWKAEQPAPKEEAPTWNDRIEAQITYTAIMTDTLLEV